MPYTSPRHMLHMLHLSKAWPASHMSKEARTYVRPAPQANFLLIVKGILSRLEQPNVSLVMPVQRLKWCAAERVVAAYYPMCKYTVRYRCSCFVLARTLHTLSCSFTLLPTCFLGVSHLRGAEVCVRDGQSTFSASQTHMYTCVQHGMPYTLPCTHVAHVTPVKGLACFPHVKGGEDVCASCLTGKFSADSQGDFITTGATQCESCDAGIATQVMRCRTFCRHLLPHVQVYSEISLSMFRSRTYAPHSHARSQYFQLASWALPTCTARTCVFVMARPCSLTHKHICIHVYNMVCPTRRHGTCYKCYTCQRFGLPRW